jgi:hypothetical protein
MTPNPETRLVMLPKVVTGQLIEKFDNFSLYNQAAGFETGSTSNSNSMTTWIEPRELAPELSCRPVLPHEHFPYNLRSASAVYVAALITCRAGKEIVSKYSDSMSSLTTTRTPLTSSTSDWIRSCPSPSTTLLRSHC